MNWLSSLANLIRQLGSNIFEQRVFMCLRMIQFTMVCFVHEIRSTFQTKNYSATFPSLTLLEQQIGRLHWNSPKHVARFSFTPLSPNSKTTKIEVFHDSPSSSSSDSASARAFFKAFCTPISYLSTPPGLTDIFQRGAD